MARPMNPVPPTTAIRITSPCPIEVYPDGHGTRPWERGIWFHGRRPGWMDKGGGEDRRAPRGSTVAVGCRERLAGWAEPGAALGHDLPHDRAAAARARARQAGP